LISFAPLLPFHRCAVAVSHVRRWLPWAGRLGSSQATPSPPIGAAKSGDDLAPPHRHLYCLDRPATSLPCFLAPLGSGKKTMDLLWVLNENSVIILNSVVICYFCVELNRALNIMKIFV